MRAADRARQVAQRMLDRLDQPTTVAQVNEQLARPAAGDPPEYLATAARLGQPTLAAWIDRACEAPAVDHTPKHRDETTGGGK